MQAARDEQRRTATRRSAAGALVGIWLLLAGLPAHAAEPAVTLAAAASLRQVLPALIEAYRQQTHTLPIAVTFGSSGDLRRQVASGAPIDAVLFAASAPVDELIQAGHADAESRRVIASNTLVLIGPKDSPPLTFATLDRIDAHAKIAIGDPGAVPAGQYARDALRALGKWDALQGRLVLGGDVGAVLTYARRGEVAAAIVYRTEVRGLNDVVVLDEATGDWAPRPQVVVAVTRGGTATALAAAFLNFLSTPAAQAILRDYGFGPP